MSGRWRRVSGGWRWRCRCWLLLAVWQGRGRGQQLPSGSLVAAVAVGGLFFAADLAAWHVGILQTKLANATLFGNFASFLFAIYGFVLLRRLPGRVPTIALLLAVFGTALLLGRSYELSHVNLVGDLFCLLAGLFYTFYLIAVDRARRSLAAFPTLFIATAAGALPMLLFALALGETVLPTDWWPVDPAVGRQPADRAEPAGLRHGPFVADGDRARPAHPADRRRRDRLGGLWRAAGDA
jgi:drug/metabolite transporter (DMT)-like permease